MTKKDKGNRITTEDVLKWIGVAILIVLLLRIIGVF